MNTVKTITKDGYTLTHSWYIDDLGLRHNTIDVFHEATRRHYPMAAPIRVQNYGPDDPIEGDDVSPYTDEEYQEMLQRAITRLLE